jgi:hypothetical protein
MTPNAESNQVLRISIVRPFQWGGLFLFDSDADDFPGLEPGSSISASGNAISLLVRHAQDFDFTNEELDGAVVHVDLFFGIANMPCDFDDFIELPSGRLTVGDADDEEVVDLPADVYRVQISLDQPNHAEYVRIWLSQRTTN